MREEGRHLMNVRSWMTANPKVIGPKDLLSLAEQKMKEGRFRRLPVVDQDGSIVGMVTERDLRPHHGYYASTHVNAAMTESVKTIGPDATLEEAVTLLLEHKIGGLPVLEGGRLVGIITQTDLLRGFLVALRGEGSEGGRIDFRFGSEAQTFAEAVSLVETAGATVLGLGTAGSEEAAEGRTFFLRVLAPDLNGVAGMLRAAGYVLLAVHGLRKTDT